MPIVLKPALFPTFAAAMLIALSGRKMCARSLKKKDQTFPSVSVRLLAPSPHLPPPVYIEERPHTETVFVIGKQQRALLLALLY